MHRDPPPGYNRPSLAQVLQCDKAAWSRLSTIVADVRQQADGTFPLGEALLNLRHDPSISLYLAPVVKPTSTSSTQHVTRAERPSPYSTSGKGKGKNKGGRKGKGSGPPCACRVERKVAQAFQW